MGTKNSVHRCIEFWLRFSNMLQKANFAKIVNSKINSR